MVALCWYRSLSIRRTNARHFAVDGWEVFSCFLLPDTNYHYRKMDNLRLLLVFFLRRPHRSRRQHLSLLPVSHSRDYHHRHNNKQEKSKNRYSWFSSDSSFCVFVVFFFSDYCHRCFFFFSSLRMVYSLRMCNYEDISSTLRRPSIGTNVSKQLRERRVLFIIVLTENYTSPRKSERERERKRRRKREGRKRHFSNR